MTSLFEAHDIEAIQQLPADRHPAHQYLAQLGPGSRRTMTEALAKIARLVSSGQCTSDSLPWHLLRREHTLDLRERLVAHLAPATTNKHLAALRGVLKQASKLGMISADHYRSAIDLPAVRGPAPRESRSLSREELASLMGACERDRSPAGARDAALFALLFGAGLRRSEVVALALVDYEQSTGILRLPSIGSRAPRRFTASHEGRHALERWLGRRGLAAGPLFNPVNKGGRIEIRGLSEQAIYIACRKRASEAGLPPVSPEDLRRSMRVGQARRPHRAVPSKPGAVASVA